MDGQGCPSHNNLFEMTEQLTPQQETLFLKYLEKWRKVALSTEPINRKKAEAAIRTAYTLIDEPQPQIFFFDSPYAAVVALDKLEDEIGCSELDSDDMLSRLWDRLKDSFTFNYLSNNKDDKLIWMQSNDLHKIITDDFVKSTAPRGSFIWIPYEFKPGNVQPDTICIYMPWYDFCISELKCDRNSEIWQTFQEIVNNCGWIASYQELCVVCVSACSSASLSPFYTYF